MGTNRDRYSFNDPVNLSDPNGNEIIDDNFSEEEKECLQDDAQNAPAYVVPKINDRNWPIRLSKCCGFISKCLRNIRNSGLPWHGENILIHEINVISQKLGNKLPRTLAGRSGLRTTPNDIVSEFYGWKGVDGANALNRRVNDHLTCVMGSC